MERKKILVLHIEDDAGQTKLMRKYFSEVKGFFCDLIHAEQLSTGLKNIKKNRIDVILLDLDLPDCKGINSYLAIKDENQNIPVIVVTGHDDDTIALRAMKEGAQDYLIKGEITSQLLERSILYAIERHRLMTELRHLSLTDDLTGLYNRRGFLTLAKQNLKIAHRLYDRNKVFLFSADVDNLKQINDKFGHKAGDNALKETTKILNKTFRESDIISRMGGDEFAVLTIGDINTNENNISERFYKNLENHNDKKNHDYILSISCGVIPYEYDSPLSLDELLDKADNLMYKQKQSKKA